VKPDHEATVYAGRRFSVTRERWGSREREIVEAPDVVVVLAVDREGLVTLVRQLREAVRRRLLELPAGVVEEGEELLATARRELVEETGLHGGQWRAAVSWWSTPGFCRERVHLFIAEDVEQGVAAPADDEQIEVERWSLADVQERLGEIEDSKTIIGLQLYLSEVSQSGPDPRE
jgi:ADP-ribose pyrophosphatase